MDLVQITRRGIAGMFSTIRSLSTTLPYLIHGKAAFYQKVVTEQYPDPVSSRSKEDLPPRTRGQLFNDIGKCSGCGDCEKICPTNAIKVETKLLKDLDRAWVVRFDVDLGRCILCGLCTEVCAPQSLVHSREFENASSERSQLILEFGRGEVTDEKRASFAIGKRERRSW